MKKLLPAVGIAVFAALPLSAFAAVDCKEGLQRVFCTFGDLIGVLTPIVVALALLAFFWGLAMYILNFSGEDKDKKKGRDMMMYGVITLFVIVSVWGLVQVLQKTFIGDGNNPDTVPLPYIIPK